MKLYLLKTCLDIKLYSGLILGFALLLAGCATTEPEPPNIPAARFSDKQEALKTYRAGLQQIIDIIPSDNPETDGSINLLGAIKRFLYPEVFWGYIDANNRMFSLSSGHKAGLWILFLENDHASLLDPGPSLVAGEQGELIAVTVRPDKVSERWAGIFLMHELAHGFEKLIAKNFRADASEYYAYLIEMESYNFLTENNLNKGLDKLLNEYAIHRHEALLSLVKSKDGLDYNFLYELDNYLGEEKPLSLAAEEMRLGFYLMAASIRIGQLNQTSLDEKINNLNALISYASRY